MVKPTVISTFAGCGGSSLGYQMAAPNLMKAIAEHIKINILQRMKDAFPEIEIKRLND